MRLTNMQFIVFAMLIPCAVSAFFVYLVILLQNGTIYTMMSAAEKYIQETFRV